MGISERGGYRNLIFSLFFFTETLQRIKTGASVQAHRQAFDWIAGCWRDYALEKAMATHSSVLAWRIPGTGEPGGLPSMGSHRVGHD